MRIPKRTLWAAWFALAMISEQGCFGGGGANGVYAHTNSNGTITTNSARATMGVAPSGHPTASAATSHVDTTGFVANQSDSQALTAYLKQRRLPLVGAQVLQGPDGQRAVVLYGYVGSDFGKGDAAAKAGNYLNDPGVAIDNRIKVQPELLSTGSASNGTNPSEASAEASNADNSGYPGVEAYTQQQNGAQQYVPPQQAVAPMNSMSPLMMLGLMALSAASGGNFSFNPGGLGGGLGGGYYGPPSINPYTGFPLPGYPPSSPGYGPFGP